MTPPPRLPALAPGRIVDLHAIGEALALALPRGTLGEVRPLASAARYVTLANQSILAFEARQSATGGLDIWGAAADIGRDWRDYWRV